jgi:hypothetical protein
MSRKILLLITGLIPLFFIIPVLYFFIKDNRMDLISEAKLLEPNSKLGEIVKFDAVISNQNKTDKEEFAYYVKEKYVKGERGSRSEWKLDSSLSSIILLQSSNYQIIAELDKDYVPCGSDVKVIVLEPKKSRILGLKPGTLVSGIGQITKKVPAIQDKTLKESSEPDKWIPDRDTIRIDTKKSLCTGDLKSYVSQTESKKWSYLGMGICILLPSLGILFLALKRSV